MRAAVPVLSVVGLLAGCGSPSPAASVSPSSTASPAGSSATPTPAAAAMAVWGLASADGRTLEIREAPLDGGSAARSVARLDGGYRLLAVGGGRAMVAQESSLTLVDLGSGTVTPQPAVTSGTPGAILGGAFSPDGARFACAAGSPSGGGLQVLDIASHSVRTLVRFPSNVWQAPQVWTASGITAVRVRAFSEGFSDGMTLIDDHTGSTLGSSSFTGGSGGGGAVAPDGRNAGVATHTPGMGDDSEGIQGPPRNTISTVRVGSPPVAVLQRAHHDMSVFAARSGDGALLVGSGTVAPGSGTNGLAPLIVGPGGRTVELDRGYDVEAGAFGAAGAVVAAVSPAGTTSSVELVVYRPPGGAGGAYSRRVIEPSTAGRIELVAIA